MADDSVPLPFPNLKVPQWHYQMENIERMKDEASSSYWKAVEADEMAPYLRKIGSTHSDLVEKLAEKNVTKLTGIEEKLKDAEENLGESEISELLRSKAMYLCRIGDKDNAISALDTALEKTAGLGARIDLVLAIVRVGLFYSDVELVTTNITRATDLIDSGGDWDRRNRLKIYRAIHHLSIRDFKEAAELLIDSLSTFTSTELMEYEEFVALTVLAAGVGCDRKGIKTKILASSEVNGCLSSIPHLASMTDSLHKSNYAQFFLSLAEVEMIYLLPVPWLAPHARFYVREMRIKAYSQLMESYRSLTMERMCRSFGVSEAFMDQDLSRFIASGRLSCTIDKVSGVITTNKLASQNKTVVYEQVVKQGDILLSDMAKLHRVMSSLITYGHPPPPVLTILILPIATLLIIHPLLPLLLPTSLASLIPLPPQPTFPALQANLGFSLLAFLGSIWAVPWVGASFVEKGLSGRDLCKSGGRTSGPWIPECLGLPIACWYIGLMMLFIPFPFSLLFDQDAGREVGREAFPQGELTLYLSSLLSLLTATLLGFVDDLFDIRWRHKLPIPLIAAVPTLLVYYSEGGLTSVVLPGGLGSWIHSFGMGGWSGSKVVDLGPLYYIYLVLLPTFTTNSFNILAGINGIEVTQALVIALSVAFNDLLFLPIWPRSLLIALGGIGNPHEGRILEWAAGEVVKRHLMSFYFMAPLIGVCAGFLWHNGYPAKAFPGDTFCYFTGMAFSAVAIQGHFSKTLVLFFVPQVFNFILSCPQLFGLVTCPRHRLPAYDASSGLLGPSLTMFERAPPAKTRITLRVLEFLRLVRLDRIDVPTESPKSSSKPRSQIISSTNLTILNFLLIHFGPMHERTLCLLAGTIQAACSVLAFAVRYGIGAWVYGGERR
ncbi:MAG: tunicamycin resistance protein [Tremellales sp. Tagirdzhanova-0007]|nr:MAG: tunicamycin resistance protein [Tremellales sp. Tagirdzhanova-0007]